MSKEFKIMAGIAAVIIIGAALLLSKTPKTTAPTNSVGADKQQYLVRGNSHMTGNKNAKVTIVEFGDYQCPACEVAFPTVEKLIAEYKNNSNVNFIFRNFPLPQHQYALVSAEAAEAAGAQGKYWEMYAKLYGNQSEWVNSTTPLNVFAGYAQQLGLNVDTFKQDVQANKYSAMIQQDLSDGTNLGVNATPTFYINGEQKVGIPDFQETKTLIDQKLNAQ